MNNVDTSLPLSDADSETVPEKPRRVGKMLPTSAPAYIRGDPDELSGEEWWYEMALAAEPVAAVFLPCDPAIYAMTRLLELDDEPREKALAEVRDLSAAVWRREAVLPAGTSDELTRSRMPPVDIAILTTTPESSPLDTHAVALASSAALDGAVDASVLDGRSTDSVRTVVLLPPESTDQRPSGFLIELWTTE